MQWRQVSIPNISVPLHHNNVHFKRGELNSRHAIVHDYLATKQGEHPAILRNMVTSPAGTTASAIYELENGKFRVVIKDVSTTKCKPCASTLYWAICCACVLNTTSCVRLLFCTMVWGTCTLFWASLRTLLQINPATRPSGRAIGVVSRWAAIARASDLDGVSQLKQWMLFTVTL